MQHYCELTLTVSPEALEAVFHVLQAHVGGIAVDDEGEARVRVYLPRDAELPARLESLRADLVRLDAFFPGMRGLVWSEGDVGEEDWADAWRAHFHPVRLGRRLVVAPTWEVPRTFAGEVVLRLDPGMAFGTGTHASTALCLGAVERLVAAGGRGLDVGTGSGILAVTAALLGAERVTALDIDPVAVRVSKENVRLNGVEAVVDVRYASLGDVLAAGCAPADWALANLTADVVVSLARDLARGLRAGGMLVASGIVDAGLADVLRALAGVGLRPLRVETLQGWHAVWAERGPEPDGGAPAGAVP